MRKLRFSEDQIVSILRQPEMGCTVEEVCRKAGIARQTFYRWRLKYSGLLPAEIKRIRSLEDENTRLRKVVALMSLDEEPLQLVLRRMSKRLSGLDRFSGLDRLFAALFDPSDRTILADPGQEETPSFSALPAHSRSGAEVTRSPTPSTLSF
jgi:putative transposase